MPLAPAVPPPFCLIMRELKKKISSGNSKKGLSDGLSYSASKKNKETSYWEMPLPILIPIP